MLAMLVLIAAYRMLGEYTQSRSHGVQEIIGAADSSVQNWGCQTASNESSKDDDRCAHHFGCH